MKAALEAVQRQQKQEAAAAKVAAKSRRDRDEAERERVAAEAKPAPTPEPAQPAPAPVVMQQAANAERSAASGKRISLGEINVRIAPLRIDAAGLAQIGFQPVASERASKLYDEASFLAMCTRLRTVLSDAQNVAEAA